MMFALREEGNPVCKHAKVEGSGTWALSLESERIF
jgi:hypothetical protein